MKAEHLPVVGFIPALGIVAGIVIGFVFLGPRPDPVSSPPAAPVVPTGARATNPPGYQTDAWKADFDRFLCRNGAKPGCLR